MTASNADNVVLSKNGLTVTIATTPDDEENLTKSLITFNPPKSFDNQPTDTNDADYGPNATKIIDILNKVEQRITVNGFLVSYLGDSDTNNDAIDKKADLKNIFLGGGVVSMTYEGSTFNMNMDKLSIKRVNTDGNMAPNGVMEFSVKFTAIRGEDL